MRMRCTGMLRMALWEFWGAQQCGGTGEDVGQGRYETAKVRFWRVKEHLGVWTHGASEQAGRKGDWSWSFQAGETGPAAGGLWQLSLPMQVWRLRVGAGL